MKLLPCTWCCKTSVSFLTLPLSDLQINISFSIRVTEDYPGALKGPGMVTLQGPGVVKIKEW